MCVYRKYKIWITKLIWLYLEYISSGTSKVPRQLKNNKKHLKSFYIIQEALEYW